MCGAVRTMVVSKNVSGTRLVWSKDGNSGKTRTVGAIFCILSIGTRTEHFSWPPIMMCIASRLTSKSTHSSRISSFWSQSSLSLTSIIGDPPPSRIQRVSDIILPVTYTYGTGESDVVPIQKRALALERKRTVQREGAPSPISCCERNVYIVLQNGRNCTSLHPAKNFGRAIRLPRGVSYASETSRSLSHTAAEKHVQTIYNQ